MSLEHIATYLYTARGSAYYDYKEYGLLNGQTRRPRLGKKNDSTARKAKVKRNRKKQSIHRKKFNR